ncbi:hypothetical protein [Sulfitobacter geojensis]|uniref:hypothetical protein n=1 Tax=Sulfitobacter geojensis TaxID=1342299 RepID=UPI0019122290|nr:hypothetical protein [Sulfitobacter geojensis]
MRLHADPFTGDTFDVAKRTWRIDRIRPLGHRVNCAAKRVVFRHMLAHGLCCRDENMRSSGADVYDGIGADCQRVDLRLRCCGGFFGVKGSHLRHPLASRLVLEDTANRQMPLRVLPAVGIDMFHRSSCLVYLGAKINFLRARMRLVAASVPS